MGVKTKEKENEKMEIVLFHISNAAALSVL